MQHVVQCAHISQPAASGLALRVLCQRRVQRGRHLARPRRQSALCKPCMLPEPAQSLGKALIQLTDAGLIMKALGSRPGFSAWKLQHASMPRA